MKHILFTALLLVAVLGTGCASLGQLSKNVESATTGIERRVILFSATGEPIKTYEGNFYVESGGGEADFIYNGKKIILNGTYLIEEI